MFSDGVIEAFKTKGHSDADFYSFIEALQTSNPKTLADAILNMALSACGGVPKDDMTVMCAHIGKG
jgi:stage II sporulation protein E